MSGTMSQADLVADLKASLHDAAEVFTAASDADFVRHLDLAARDLGRFRRRTLVGTITLTADVDLYAAPADLSSLKSHLWGISPTAARKPWEKGHPGRLPDMREAEVNGVQAISLVPPPTAAQIAMLGSEFRYYYFAAHTVGAAAADTTVKPSDRGLLLLRAQAEAMKEMAMRNIKKPVQLRDGLSSAPRNGTPASLFQALMEQFEKEAA
jgi:hypothetical protein